MDVVRIPVAIFLFMAGLASLTQQLVGRPGLGVFDSWWTALAAVVAGYVVFGRLGRSVAQPIAFMVGMVLVIPGVLAWPRQFGKSDADRLSSVSDSWQ